MTESEIIKPKTLEYYDLLELLKLMESKGHLSKSYVLENYIDEYGLSSGTYQYLGFDYYKHSNTYKELDMEFREYFKELNILLGLPEENDGIYVDYSW